LGKDHLPETLNIQTKNLIKNLLLFYVNYLKMMTSNFCSDDLNYHSNF